MPLLGFSSHIAYNNSSRIAIGLDSDTTIHYNRLRKTYTNRVELILSSFRVFSTRRQQNEETYRIIFNESTNAIKFTKPSDNNITIAESERYPPDEYLHLYEPSQRYQVNSNVVSFIEPYEKPEPIVTKTDGSSDQNDQADENDQNDHPAQDDVMCLATTSFKFITRFTG
ncbi:hypothetical protein Tco_0287766 [Tanacetum coccineum]